MSDLSDVNKKTVLIIGGTGLLGRGVAAEFGLQDWKVTLLSRGGRDVPEELAGCEHLVADRKQINELAGILGDRRFDSVVDCAVYDEGSAQDAVDFFVTKTGHYWLISTDFVYAKDPNARYPLRVNAGKQYEPAYAAGKLAAEAIVLAAARDRGFPVTVLRPPHILGEGRPAGCDPAAGGRDADLVRRVRDGEKIPLLLGGEYLIQPLWSKELGRCAHQLHGRSETFGEVFNLAGAEAVTVRQYYVLLAELCGVELNFESVDIGDFAAAHPGQAHMTRHRIYDISPLAHLGFQPSLKLGDALEATLSPWL